MRTSRRQLLRSVALGSAGLMLAACQPQVLKETVVVEKQVEKVVKETVIVAGTPVEKVVQQTVVVEATKAPVKEITLRVHTNQDGQYAGAFKYAYEKDVLGWHSQHPNVTLQVEPVPGWTDEYFPKIAALVASKTLGDIVWFPPRHRSHIGWGVNNKIVIDLMPLVQSTNYDLKQFYPGVVESSTWEGKYYFMPLNSEPVVPVMAFNKTLVEQWKLPMPTNDWTLDDLVNFGKEGTRDGVWGYHTGSASMDPLSWGPQLRQLGLKWISDDGKKVFPDSRDALIKGLQYRHDLIYKDKTMPPPDPSFNTDDVFVAGKILAMDVWPVYINQLPVLAKDKFAVDFVYCSIDQKGAKRRSMLNEHVHGVTTASKNPDVAFDFLKLMASEELCAQFLFTGSGAPVGRPDLYEDQRAIKAYPGLALLKPIMEGIEPDFFVQNFRGDEFDKVFQDATTLLALDKLSVAECADKLYADCQAVVDKEPA